MASPFQPTETTEQLQPAPVNTGLTEYSSFIQNTQQVKTEQPQVMSPDGKQLVIPPIGQTAATTDQTNPAAAATTPPQEVAAAPPPKIPPPPMWMRFAPAALQGKLFQEWTAEHTPQPAQPTEQEKAAKLAKEQADAKAKELADAQAAQAAQAGQTGKLPFGQIGPTAT